LGEVLVTVGVWIAGESSHIILLLWQRLSCITPVVSTDYWNDYRQNSIYAERNSNMRQNRWLTGIHSQA